MQFTVAFRVLGLLLMVFSLTMLPPIGVSLWYDDGNLAAFVDAMVFTFFGGALIWLPARRARRELRTRDGFFVVTLMWAGMSAFAAIPFMLTQALSASYTDAFFEAMSGLTTTGATAFTGLDALPQSILYYRQQLQWLGGMGIIVLAVAILPMLGIGGMQLFRAEAAGSLKDNKLTPRIAGTAKALWLIYLGLTVLCALAYWWAGMNSFDAIGHAFSTIAIGGFSTHDASIGWFDSPLVEAICIFFMLLSAVSFVLHFTAWRHRTVAAYWRDPELRFFVFVLLVVVALVTAGLLAHDVYEDPVQAIRYGLFESVSIVTTTGFGITDYSQWPLYVPWVLLFASFIGGCSGSTAGGMKVLRILLLVRQSVREFQRLTHPNGVFLVKLGRQPVSEGVVEAVWGFISLYIFMTIVLSIAITGTGVDWTTAFSGVAACINNLGPGLGDVSANVASLNDTAAWLLSFAMLIGRLEIFTVLILFTSMFWRR